MVGDDGWNALIVVQCYGGTHYMASLNVLSAKPTFIFMPGIFSPFILQPNFLLNNLSDIVFELDPLVGPLRFYPYF